MGLDVQPVPTSRPPQPLRYGAAALLSLAVGFASGFGPDPRRAWPVMVISLAVFIVASGRAVTGYWLGALIDDRNKMSLSRFQMVVWTIVLLSSLLAAALWNLREADTALAIEVPQELLFLMGISLGSAAASPLIRNAKHSQQPDPGEMDETVAALTRQRGREAPVGARGVVLVNLSPSTSAWSDMVRGEEAGNGAHLDLGKVQNLYFTLIFALAYAGSVWTALGKLDNGQAMTALPSISGSLVSLLGISHAGYLGYKMVPHSERAVGGTAVPSTGPVRGQILQRRATGAPEHPETEPTP